MNPMLTFLEMSLVSISIRGIYNQFYRRTFQKTIFRGFYGKWFLHKIQVSHICSLCWLSEAKGRPFLLSINFLKTKEKKRRSGADTQAVP